MKAYKGMMMLMMTSVLMMVSLLMSLSYSSMVFYQIKRVSNEVAERNAYWLAEGGIECVYLQTQDSMPFEPDLSRCYLPTSLSLDIALDTDLNYLVSSSYKGVTIKRVFSFVNNPVGKRQPVWLKGSWHDF